MYVTYTRIYGWSDYGGESSYQPGYRLENMMWMTLLVYDYIIPGESNRHWDGHGKIIIDRRAVAEYLLLIGEKELPLNLFKVADIEDRFPVERVNELLNEKK